VIEQTGGGGHHAYYTSADDVPNVPNYGNGLEIKSEGALVIAAPSRHANGRRYEWLPGHAPWEIAVASLPDAIINDLRNRPRANTSSAHLAPQDQSLMREGRDVGLSREQVRALALKRYRKAIWKAREQGDLEGA
jgi:bifunctional DNA primase/polymerase-like protein